MRLTEIDRGARGQQVQMLQHLLNTVQRPRPPLELDGVFGPATERAVRDYQASRNLEIDGIVGADTWKSFGAAGATLPPPAPAAAASITRPTRAVPVPSIRQLPIAAMASPTSGRQAPGTASAAAPTRPAPMRAARLDPPGSSLSAPWMRVAAAEKGVGEILGPQNHKRIVEYHATTSFHSQLDSVAWCASFVNWCLKQAGVRGTHSAAAASFANWGQALETPRFGCIIQLYHPPRRRRDGRTGSSSGNHVGFFVRQTATHITLLGGNQSRRVQESNFPLSSYQIKAMRWPG